MVRNALGLLLLLGLVFAIASRATAYSAGRVQVKVSGSQVSHIDGSGFTEASNGPDGAVIERPYDALPVQESLMASKGTGMSSAFGFASILTSPGGAQATVNGSVGASPSSEFIAYANATNEATASYLETFRILVAGVPLDAGLVVNASVFTTGTLLAQSFSSTDDAVDWGQFIGPAAIAISNAHWTATASVNSAGLETTATKSNFCIDNTREEFLICSSNAPGLDLEFYAINGQLITVELEANAYVALGAQAHGLSTKAVSGNADGVSDIGAPTSGGTTAGGAVGWGGITAVSTLGNPVDLADVSAIGLDSGFDYMQPYQPVPEATGWIAAVTALCALRSFRQRPSSPR